MSLPKGVWFLIFFLSYISLGWCEYPEHPVVYNIKDILKNKKVTEDCNAVLRIFVENVNVHFWANKMLDATSKIPIDANSYNFIDLGHFSQCTEVESIPDNIKGQYCIGNVVVNSSIAHLYLKQIYNQDLKRMVNNLRGGVVKLVGKPTWSMCLPSNCSVDDSTVIMNALQPFGIGLTNVYCQTIADVYPKWTRDAFIGISVLGFLAFIILISTSYDIYCQNKKKGNTLTTIKNAYSTSSIVLAALLKKKETHYCAIEDGQGIKYTKAHPGLVAFSIYTNGKKLFEIPKRSSNLNCLDGIRVLSMFWILILHTWDVYTSGAVFNSKDSEDLSYSLLTIIFMNGELACDTFLLIGGALVTYVYFKKYKGDNLTFPAILKHYFHRFIRLTPPLAGVVLVSATLLRYMGSGPKWPYIVNSFEGFCKKYWWSSLLYVQNEVNVNKMCVGHSWYLDVDMQLYIFSPLIFWLLSKYTKTGITFLIFAMFSSIAVSFLRAFEDKLSAVYPYSNSQSSANAYMNDYYLKTETRAAPWIMGTLLGYILTRKACTEINLSKKITIPIWILTISIIFICMFGGYSTLRGPEYYKFQNVLYITLVRPTFALAVGWIIWACSTNHGGLINSILSLSIFQFLNRFIYSIYLLHVTALYMIIYSSKSSLYMSNFNFAYWFWGIFMFMFGLSVVWVLVFESPIMILEKIIFPPSDTKEEFSKQERGEKKI